MTTAYRRTPSDPLFSLARGLLFRVDPERAHDLALSHMERPGIQRWLAHRYGVFVADRTHCMGLSFPNPIGLAAGLDKNGDYVDALGALGFGSIEVGTVTPRPQTGNPKPRLFRLASHRALINRMGFNNLGVDHLVRQVQQRTYAGRLGINIGKNADTALDNAVSDYLTCMKKVYPVADYITVNVSSPNTKGLRDLQHGDRLRELLGALKEAQSSLATQHSKHVPLLVKIAPDMDAEELGAFCGAVLEFEIDGVISGNTTRERAPVADDPLSKEDGGMSGAPLKPLADERLAQVAAALQGKVALIGVGGVSCGQDASDKLTAGADLVQLYTGLIYQGPALVRDCIRSTT